MVWKAKNLFYFDKIKKYFILHHYIYNLSILEKYLHIFTLNVFQFKQLCHEYSIMQYCNESVSSANFSRTTKFCLF